MDPFFPEKSKIFSAAAFANFYSSLPVTTLRVLIALSLTGFLLLSIYQPPTRLTYLLIAFSILFFNFEVFYRAKLLREKPLPLSKDHGENLADCFEIETARLLEGLVEPTFQDLFGGLIKHKEILFLLARADISPNEFKSLVSSQNQRVDQSELSTYAAGWAQAEKRIFIDNLDLFLAATDRCSEVKKLFFDKELKEADLINIAFWAREVFPKDKRAFWEKPVATLGPGIGEIWMGGWTLETEKYTFDLSKQIVKERKSVFLIGKMKEIEMVEEVLSRSDKRNVILLGAPGIGKSSLVYGLAEKSIRGSLPPALKYKRFLELSVTSLLAGASAGQLEERMQNILTEISHAGNAVLFIPQIENVAGSSGTGTNITGHLLSALNSTQLQVIGTTTHQEYHKYIENQGTFAALFEVVEVDEPSREETIRILEQTAAKVESKNKIMVTYKAILEAIKLSDRYFVDRVLPGKAVDLLDESATAITLKKKGVLEVGDIQTIVQTKTKIPLQEASKQEAVDLLNLEQILHQRIVGQETAVKAVAAALRRARAIERETKRPIGSFLFLGPTGVGKTETAKTLADQYYGSEDQVIRIDMSEFQEENSIDRLIGSAVGGVGELSEKVRENPFSLILLDELEKAHPKVQEAFLPVLDEGVVKDAQGHKVVFTNNIIIATSNAGAEFIRESIQQNTSAEELKKSLLEKLQREGVFKPEFLNRFDEVVVYKPLSEAEIQQVVKLMLKELEARLLHQNVVLTIDEATVAWVASSGFDQTYGARPLRRFITDNLENKIAEKILSGSVKKGSQVKVSLENNQLVIR